MGDEIYKDAEHIILDNLNKYSNEREIAYNIKREYYHIILRMDKKQLPSWHCIVGRNFGIYVTYDEGHYLYATKGQTTIVLWK